MVIWRPSPSITSPLLHTLSVNTKTQTPISINWWLWQCKSKLSITRRVKSISSREFALLGTRVRHVVPFGVRQAMSTTQCTYLIRSAIEELIKLWHLRKVQSRLSHQIIKAHTIHMFLYNSITRSFSDRRSGLGI